MWKSHKTAQHRWNNVPLHITTLLLSPTVVTLILILNTICPTISWWFRWVPSCCFQLLHLLLPLLVFLSSCVCPAWHFSLLLCWSRCILGKMPPPMTMLWRAQVSENISFPAFIYFSKSMCSHRFCVASIACPNLCIEVSHDYVDILFDSCLTMHSSLLWNWSLLPSSLSPIVGWCIALHDIHLDLALWWR